MSALPATTPMLSDLTTNRLRDRFLATAAAATADPLAFLPEWCREIDSARLNEVPIICCGANVPGWLFLQAATELNVIAVVDDFKKGQDYGGHTCIGVPEFIALARKTPGAVCVNLAQWDLGFRYFANLGRRFGLRMLNFGQAVRFFDCQTIDFRVADWRPAIVARASEFLAVEEMLCDELSKQTLFEVLNYHLDTDREHLLGVNRAYDAHYFRSGLFELRRDEVFVDCGAAIGETVDHFLEMTEEQFAHLYAFEPDAANFGQLRQRVDRYRNRPFYSNITLFNQATGAEDRTVTFDHSGGDGARIVEDGGEGAMPMVRLDSALPNGATFLKIDVEGYDLATLHGAERTIREYRPRIAVCVYHRDDDLLTIPTYLKSLNPDYRIGLRHCNQVRFDTICFAF